MTAQHGCKSESVQNLLVRQGERDREVHNVRRSLGPQWEAAVPRRSKRRKELLEQAESPQALKQSDYKAGNRPRPTAGCQNSFYRLALKIPNAGDPCAREHAYEHDRAHGCAWCSNENATLFRHLNERRHDDNHAPDGGYAPTPRTTRTTSSQGSSEWKVGEACSFPWERTSRFETRQESNANTLLNSTRWMHNS